MHVIGTAGHVDHGKSSLVQALTGIDPDRLKEEKEREMTIDLGFAWMKSVDGQQEIGIVDVPGHRDFIENMLAGIGGIDLALLVIAVDEGVMPQTKEHLAIIDLLEVNRGIIALTKIDLIDDEDWIELVILDISEAVTGTIMEDAPIIGVSAHTGAGIESLKETIWGELGNVEEKIDRGQPRLPVDRVFSLAGFGTIATGTLLDGQLIIGQVIEVQPTNISGRIRGLQTHKTKIETAQPGSRVAVNISGIDKDGISRGDVVALPGTLSGTILCDVSYQHLQEVSEPLRHNQEVKFFSGASEVVARTRVIGAKAINPGTRGWLQLAFRESVALQKNDRYIIRRPSPAATLGGGAVLDPHPGRRHRRFKNDVIDRFNTLERGLPSEIMTETLNRYGLMTKDELIARSGLSQVEGNVILGQLLDINKVRQVDNLYITSFSWERFLERAVLILESFHSKTPLRIGMPREELRSRLGLASSQFNILLIDLVNLNSIELVSKSVKLPRHKITFSAKENQKIEKLMAKFSELGVNSPSVKIAKSYVGEDVYSALLDLGDLKAIAPDVVYRGEDYKHYIQRVIDHLKENERINAGELRDLLKTSRKYAIAILEHLDDKGVTRRVGDERHLVNLPG
jgi:selenocysteine-specific elongation factor